jgi:hypothetical protein
MVFLWRGFGFLVLVVAGAALLGAQALAEQLGGGGLWRKHAWPAALALLVAGVACWFLGRRLNRAARAAENRRPWTHDLFFVRMEWWSFPLAALAVTVLLTGWKPGDASRTVNAATDDVAEAVKSVTK